MNESKHDNKHRKDAGYSIWSLDTTGKEDTERKFLSTGISATGTAFVRTAHTLGRYNPGFPNQLPLKKKKKNLQKFKVLF